MLGDRLPKDKILHFAIGTGALVFATLVAALQIFAGTGPAAALFTTGLGIGLELYQKVRKESTPDWKDVVATAAPGYIFWAILIL